jgi:ribosome biogenesis protein Nip4
MKVIATFASHFGAKMALNPESVIKKEQRYYLINPRVRKLLRNDFLYAGLYLGEVKSGTLYPSFNLLNMLVDSASNKVVLDRKSAWLFICGRDVFKKGISRYFGARQKGQYVLVLNEFGECLGFGKIIENLDILDNKLVIENLFDVGDFLRRER